MIYFIVEKPLKSPKNEIVKEEIEVILTKVTIECFPSRTELFLLLETFLSDETSNKEYSTENKDNAVIFTFKDSVKYSYYFFNFKI